MEISKELYQELLDIDYFNQCGKSIDGLYGFDVYVEKDFDKAIKSILKTSWSNITLEEQNNLTGYLFKNHCEEYNDKWNKQARINREELIPPITLLLEKRIFTKRLLLIRNGF